MPTKEPEREKAGVGSIGLPGKVMPEVPSMLRSQNVTSAAPGLAFARLRVEDSGSSLTDALCTKPWCGAVHALDQLSVLRRASLMAGELQPTSLQRFP